jgi:membrane protein HdeD
MTAHTTTTALGRRRTAWDVFIGVLLILAGLAVLANAVIATALSVFLLGWMALIAGLVLLGGALLRIKSGVSWSAALGGVILAVLGLFVLRNPTVGAVSLTLLAGCLFLATGLIRIVAASQYEQARWLLIISGIISLLLGIVVLVNLVTASLVLLGILLGVQMLVEGATVLAVGRLRPISSTPA